MELIKEHWTKQDLKEFQEYLLTFSKGKEKGEWEQRIVNTKLNCIAVSFDNIKKIVSHISKGNFIEFIDLWPWDNLTNTFIVGELICKIKDFEVQKQYLLKYSLKADCWATIDTIKIKAKNNKDKYIEFAKELCLNAYTFARRLGVILMLKNIDSTNVSEILDYISIFENETEFYVNMAVSWLVCECFVKHRDLTLEYLKHNNLNKFTINKAISKIRDSYRVSNEDKQLVLSFKK